MTGSLRDRTASHRLLWILAPVLALAALVLPASPARATSGPAGSAIPAASATPSGRPAQELTGQTSGGAYFRIVVPEDWNGDLVIFCNGIEANNVVPEPPLGELSDTQLAAGFAVATTSYRTNFYVLFKSLADLRALVGQFKSNFGAPRRIVLVGLSMGGLVVAEALEKGLGAEVSGALVYCGLLAGGPYLDMYGDLRLAYDVVCDDVNGAAIPGGAEGLPADSMLTYDDVVDRVIACTGVDDPRLAPGTSRPPTKAQRKRQETLLAATTIPSGEFLMEDMLVATFAVADSLRDRRKLKGKQAFTNIDVVYPDARIDRDIARIEADRKGRRKLMRHYTPKGKLSADTKVVALHEADDGFVFVQNLGEYAATVPADQLATAVAIKKAPSHCAFSGAEIRAGWSELLDWIDGGSQPAAADIQKTCSGLAGSGAADGPCQFVDEFDLGRLVDRVPAR